MSSTSSADGPKATSRSPGIAARTRALSFCQRATWASKSGTRRWLLYWASSATRS
jgi:hypothetical protein